MTAQKSAAGRPRSTTAPAPELALPCIYAGMSPTVACPCPAARPRTAKLVGIIEWAWTPLNNRMDTFHLSTNKPRTHWILWISVFDEIAVRDGPARPYAYCLRAGVAPKAAAKALLIAGWDGESAEWVDMECEPMEPFHYLSEPGLLSRREWLALRAQAWPQA